MKMIRNALICFASVFLFVPLAHGQDLSKYRDFSLGTNLVAVCKQANAKPADASVIQQSPALIQELSWWSAQSSKLSTSPESVQDIQFSFYNGDLYGMVVTYESSATQGLTAGDMVQALSAAYGAATIPVAQKNPADTMIYSTTQVVLAFWEDAQNSVTLSRSPLSNAFQLVLLSKQVNAQATAAIADAVRHAREDAPQREAARVKTQTDALEVLRQANLKAFRP